MSQQEDKKTARTFWGCFTLTIAGFLIISKHPFLGGLLSASGIAVLVLTVIKAQRKANLEEKEAQKKKEAASKKKSTKTIDK